MTQPISQGAADATREVSQHARVPDRPINPRSIGDILAWRDAYIAQGEADAEREYQTDLRALTHKPSKILDQVFGPEP